MKETGKKILSAFLAVCFCLFCMANIVASKSDYSENENRMLTQMPEFNIDTVTSGEFMTAFEKYTSDQFVLRDFFISIKARIEKFLMKTENNGIYYAADNYLIEKPSKLDRDIIDKNAEALKELKSLKRHNILFSVIPGAYEILKDKLPKNAYNSIMNEAMEYVKNSVADAPIGFCNPYEILSENKDKYIYYRTDHHQTSLGAYYSYKAITEALGLTPLPIESFTVTDVTDKFFGTTWSKAMVEAEVADTISVFTPVNGVTCTVDFPYENKKMESLYEPSKLNTKDKYSYFLDGNHGLAVIESSVKNGQEIVVLKDSYAHAIVPFLANHYEKIHMVDLRYFNDDLLKYLCDNEIIDILALYSLSGFMSDTNLPKITSLCKNSPYAGQPYGLVYESEPVGNDYFDDAIFVGDSLTEGIKLYNPVRSESFLSYVGMSLYGINGRKFPDENGVPLYSVIDLIAPSNANKFYIMLGTNDVISPESQKYFIANYSKFIDDIRKYRPDPIIYIQSILPVTPKKETEGRFKNEYIYGYNEALKQLAKEKNCYYIDVYKICADPNGAMKSEVSPDGIHLDISHYRKWFEYLKTHAVDDSRFGDAAAVTSSGVTVAPTSEKAIKIAETLKNAVPFTDSLMQVNNSMAPSIYGIEVSWIKSAVVYSGSGATAESISVFEPADNNAKKLIYEKLCSYLDERKKSFENYLPSEIAKLSMPYITEKDGYIVMCVSDHNALAEQTMNNMQ